MTRYLVLFSLLLFSACLQGQITTVDTLFLNDGSILTGRILNPESSSTIRIRNNGGAILYVNASRIEKMVLSDFREEETIVEEGPAKFQDEKIALLVQGGLAFPFGDFSSVSNAAAGFAAGGWAAKGDLWVRIAEQLYWSNRLTYTRNAFKENEFEILQGQALGVNFTNGIYSPWIGWHFQSGLSLRRQLDDDIGFIFDAEVGFSRFSSPRIIMFTDNFLEFRLDKTTGAGFNASIGAGVVYKNRYTLTLNLISSNPLFVFTGMQSSTIVQPFRVVTLTAGIMLFPGSTY
jgi:hypothetical protein